MKSIPNAPNGAVMIIAITATERTIFPHGSPAANGTEPIAACTVAFGRYAITQKALSFKVRLVYTVQSHTPNDRKINAAKIMATAASPASNV